VRIASAILLSICLGACNRGSQSNEALRQGVVDYLSQKAGMNVAAMDINLTSVKINGNQADTTVTFAAKGTKTAQMTMQYHLEQKDNKWTVIGRQDSGQHGSVQAPAGDSPHSGMGAAAGAGAENPHGAGGKMPAPEDLPPAGKKK